MYVDILIYMDKYLWLAFHSIAFPDLVGGRKCPLIICLKVYLEQKVALFSEARYFVHGVRFRLTSITFSNTFLI